MGDALVDVYPTISCWSLLRQPRPWAEQIVPPFYRGVRDPRHDPPAEFWWSSAGARSPPRDVRRQSWGWAWACKQAASELRAECQWRRLGVLRRHRSQQRSRARRWARSNREFSTQATSAKALRSLLLQAQLALVVVGPLRMSEIDQHLIGLSTVTFTMHSRSSLSTKCFSASTARAFLPYASFRESGLPISSWSATAELGIAAGAGACLSMYELYGVLELQVLPKSLAIYVARWAKNETAFFWLVWCVMTSSAEMRLV